MAGKDYVLAVGIELKDNFSQKFQNVKKEFTEVKKTIDGNTKTFSSLEQGLHKTGMSAVKVAREIGATKSALKKLAGTYQVTINAKDMAQPTLSRIKGNVGALPKNNLLAISAKDGATSKIAKIRNEIRSLTSKAHSVVLRVKENARGKVENLKGFATGAMGGMLMNTPMQMAGAFGIGYGMYDTVETYKNFEKQMQTVRALATSSMSKDKADEVMQALTAKAREMGAKTQFTATEAGKALEYMAMAGWKDEQMKSALPAVLNLALASGDDLATVSDIVTDAMTALRIDTKGTEAEKNIRQFTNVLAAASVNSNTNVRGMGEAFKYVAPLAGLFADSYANVADVGNDVALALGLMANSGIKESRAGTALRATLSRMTGDTTETKQAMQALGVEITQLGKDGKEELKPLGKIFEEMRAKIKNGVNHEDLVNFAETLAGTKSVNKEGMFEFIAKLKAQGGKLSAKDQAYFAKKLGGEEAISGLLAILNASDEDYQSLKKAIDNSAGMASKMAQIRADNLAGDIDILKSTWEDLQIEFMSGKTSKILRSFLQGLQKDIETFKNYLKDGFDLTDILRLVKNIVKQLKDEFFEFNGMGSLLAGGVLATALYKIYNITKKASGSIKSLLGTNIPLSVKNTPLTERDTVLSANTVIVNAKTGQFGTVGKTKETVQSGTTIATGTKTAQKQGKLKTIGNNLKNIKGIAGIAGVFGAIDIYSTLKDNEERLKNAKGSATATLKAEQQNKEALSKSIGGVAGGAVGMLIGGALGSMIGPLGTTVGAMFGATAGEAAGAAIGEKIPAVLEVTKKTFNSAGQAVSEFTQNAGKAIGTFVQSTGEAFEGFTSAVGTLFQTAWDGIAEGAGEVSRSIQNAFLYALDGVKNIWSDIGTWFSEVTAPIGNTLQKTVNTMWDSDATWAGETFNGVKNVYFGTKPGNLPHYASGTGGAVGGFSEINEHGGEIVDLPQGARVYPHATTMRLLEKSMQPKTNNAVSPNITITGNEFNIREEADIGKIAFELANLIEQAHLNYSPA